MIHTLVLILAILLCSGYAHAQQTNTTTNDPQTTETAVRKKAFSLLESVAGQVSTLQSAENRARLTANIVDSLWKHDEKRARDLLVLVEEDINRGLEKCDTQKPEEAHTLKVFLKLRVDTIDRIAKHDAESALAFLKATKFRCDTPLPYGSSDREESLELRLAKQIAANNPDLALKLGLQSLEQGFPFELLLVLRQLSRKHKPSAQILYKEIVKKIRDVDFAEEDDLRYFVRMLVESLMPPAADSSTFRELTNALITKALANGCEKKKTAEEDRAEFCQWVAATVTEKIDPRGGQFKHWLGEANEWDRRFVPIHDLDDLVHDGTVEEIVALASEYPEQADQIYWQAIQKARASGDLEQARKIATDKITDPQQRQAMLALLDRYERRTVVDEAKLAEVQTTLNTLPQTRDRVWYLFSVASQFQGVDRKVTLKVLNQASEIVETMKASEDQTRAQMVLAMMFCSEKSDRGWAIMESLVPKLNQLVDMAAKLDGYDTAYLRDGEWNMSANGSIGEILTRLAQNASYFAWSDFDRAVSLAAEFDRAEIRLMAQVKLAQGILAGPPKRMRIEYYTTYH